MVIGIGMILLMVRGYYFKGVHPSSLPPTVSASDTATTISTSSTTFIDLFETEGVPTLFEGTLFTDATTTLYLYKRGGSSSKEVIHGAYLEEGQGLIEGSVVPTDPRKILLDFIDYPGIFPSGHATTTLSQDGQTMQGVIVYDDGTASHSFVLKKKEPLPGSIPFSIQRISGTWQSLPFVDTCEVELEYPVTNDVDVNRLIMQAMIQPGSKSIEDDATRYLESCQDLATDTTLHVHRNGIQMSRHKIATVKLNQNGLLSLFIQGDDWDGSAHQSRVNTSVTIDLEKIKIITLGDLVDAPHLQDFLTYEKKSLLEASYGYLNHVEPLSHEEFAQMGEYQSLQSFVSSTHFLPASVQKQRYGSLQDFYLTPTGLIKYYNSYELGSWMNTPEVIMWYQGQPLFSRTSVLQRLPLFQQDQEAHKKEIQELKQALMDLPGTVTTDTSRWRTFVSKEYGYSLMYPPEFLTTIDPNQLHQTQSSPDRPEDLHDFALYYPMPEGFPTSFLVQVTKEGQWEKKQPLGYVPLRSSQQWKEEKQFLAQAHPGDGCDFLITKSEPGDTSQDCRVLRFQGMSVLDRQLTWPPSMMVGHVLTFYRGETRYDINIPNAFYDYHNFDVLDAVKKGTILEIGEKIFQSMKFK